MHRQCCVGKGQDQVKVYLRPNFVILTFGMVKLWQSEAFGLVPKQMTNIFQKYEICMLRPVKDVINLA